MLFANVCAGFICFCYGECISGCFFGFWVSSWHLVHMGSPRFSGLPVMYKTWVTKVCLMPDTPFWYCSVGALPL